MLQTWQMGKRDGEGSEGIVSKVLDSLTTANARIKELKKTGHKIDEVYVIGLGDIVENCNSQVGTQAKFGIQTYILETK